MTNYTPSEQDIENNKAIEIYVNSRREESRITILTKLTEDRRKLIENFSLHNFDRTIKNNQAT